MAHWMNAARSPVAKSASLYRRQSKAVPRLLKSASFILRHEFEQAKPFWNMETAAHRGLPCNLVSGRSLRQSGEFIVRGC